MIPDIDIITFTVQTLGINLSPYQEVLLRAIKAVPNPTPEQLAIFTECTGNTIWPTAPYTEVVCITGVRGGKDSRIATPLVLFEALLGDHGAYAMAGEPLHIPVVAQRMQSTDILFTYCRETLARQGLLDDVLDDDPTTQTLKLSNGLCITRYPAIADATRGISAPLTIMDEAAHLPRAGQQNSDEDIRVALRTRMTTFPHALLLMITSPYGRAGLVYDSWKAKWGTNDPDVLVWRATTAQMNPSSIPHIERERRVLAAAVFAREYLAEFADTEDGFLDATLLEAACTRKPAAPVRGVRYSIGFDASGGRHDHATVSVSHSDGPMDVQDYLKGWSPADFKRVGGITGVLSEVVQLAKLYNVEYVFGDHFAGDMVPNLLHELSGGRVKYRTPRVMTGKGERGHADRTAIYFAFETLLLAGRVELLAHPQMLSEFKRLERRYTGRESKIDHPSGFHDDLANATALSVMLAEQQRPKVGGLTPAAEVMDDDEIPQPEPAPKLRWAERIRRGQGNSYRYLGEGRFSSY